jgi:uncharacterized membrane protein
MKFFGRNILTGLVTILPVVLTLYLLYWLAISAETALGGLIRLILPDVLYWPGMGVIAGMGVIFLIGLLMHAYFVQRLFSIAEQVLYKMPLVRSIYGAISDFFNYFSPRKQRDFEQVVAVTMGETDLETIGFVTQADPDQLPAGIQQEGEEQRVLVYLPMSYMIGGYAVLVPLSRVRPLSMSMEEAMRFTLTAGVTGSGAGSQSRR